MRKLLQYTCHEDLLEAVEGDLLEIFEKQIEKHRRWIASTFYLFNVIQFMQPFSFKSPQYYRSIYQTYLLVIFRNMKRKKAITTMNVFGMSLTLLISMAIFSYVSDELSYDTYHQKENRIFRVTYRLQNAGGYDIHWARMNQNWVNELPNSFPEIAKMVRFQSFRTRDLVVGDQIFREKHAYAVDAEVFDLFDLELVQGSKSRSLTPYTVVLTASSAKKYFGDKNPIGQSLEISNDLGKRETYVVTAIIKDPPANTHLPITLLTSINSESERVGWAYIYLLLEEHASIQAVEDKITNFISNHQSLDKGETLTFGFQPLASIHLYSHLSREIVVNGDIKDIFIFAFVGLFLLVIGTVNFINLNTIQSLARVKEFGIRQSLGAKKGELKIYMILEAFILGLICVLLALIVFALGLTHFEQFVGHALVFHYWEMLGYLLALLISIAFLSAFASSLSLSRRDFKKISSWFSLSKGYQHTQKHFLLGLQFCSVLLLITSMVIVQRQFTFMRHKNLGYNSERLLVLSNNNRKVMRNYESLKSELKKIAGIIDVTAVMVVPSVPVKDQGLVTLLNNPQTNLSADIQVMDLNAVAVLEIAFLAGGKLPLHLQKNWNFPDSIMQKDLDTKERAYLINESACKRLGWNNPEEAIGQQIDFTIGNISLKHGPITGVVKNFHQESLNKKIRPLVITYEPLWINNILVKTNTDNAFALHASIEDLWENTFSDQPLELGYLDRALESQYQEEKRQLQLISTFTLVAILIAFMGLYGMMAYTIKLRVKELAIRRVLGSTWFDTASLLSLEYLGITIVSMSLIFPLTYWIMKKWLGNYAYHIAINGTGFALSGSLLLVIILLTLVYQIFRNGNVNPTLALKSE